MPAVTIWRDSKRVNNRKVIAIRDAAGAAVAHAEKVPVGTVEMRVRSFGPLDKNHPVIGIEIDTGAGKRRWRVKKRWAIAKEIAAHIRDTNVIPVKWLGPAGPYTWLKICESAFVPIGHPKSAR